MPACHAASRCHIAASLAPRSRHAPLAPWRHMRRAPGAAPCAGVSDIEDAVPASEPWAAVHEAACAAREATYADPATGYTVFTTLGLLAQRVCCGSGCRHCPYGELHVAPERRWRAALPLAPVTLVATRRPARPRGAPPPPEPPPGPPRRAALWTGGCAAPPDDGAAPLAAVLYDSSNGNVLFAPPAGGGAPCGGCARAARRRTADAALARSARQHLRSTCTPRMMRCLRPAPTPWPCRCRRRRRDSAERSRAPWRRLSLLRSPRWALRRPACWPLWPQCLLPARTHDTHARRRVRP